MTYTVEIRDGMKIEWDAPIRMDDGLVLRADIFRPLGAGQFPVILSYGPYGKGVAFQEAYPGPWQEMAESFPEALAGSSNKYANWEVVDPEKWVPDGYVCIRVDSRGAGRSPGRLAHNNARETKDHYLCVEWAGVQPWSNGKVGLNGISYYAANQWRVAALQPPHLSAICVWEGWVDCYRDANRHGGILCEFRKNWQSKQIKTVQHGVGERGRRSLVTGQLACGPETLSDAELSANADDLWNELSTHRLVDDYYKERSGNLANVTVPLLSAGNWGGAGLHGRGNTEGFIGAASTQKWLEIHGESHWSPFYVSSGLHIQKHFFDHFLKGADNGWDRRPKVELQVRHIDKFVQRFEDEWPIARTQWTEWYLDASSMKLSKTSSSEAAHSVSYQTMGEGLLFKTEPFEAETEITGPAALTLNISSKTRDADLFVVLSLFDPSDREVLFYGAVDPHSPVGQGWLRASHRKLDEAKALPHRPYHTHDEEQFLTPGQVVDLSIEIWPTSIVVPKDYRLGLRIRGKDYEHNLQQVGKQVVPYVMKGCGPFVHNDENDRPPAVFDSEVTVHISRDHPAVLLLPVVPQR